MSQDARFRFRLGPGCVVVGSIMVPAGFGVKAKKGQPIEKPRELLPSPADLPWLTHVRRVGTAQHSRQPLANERFNVDTAARRSGGRSIVSGRQRIGFVARRKEEGGAPTDF